MFEKMFMYMAPLILTFRTRSFYPHPTPTSQKKFGITGVIFSVPCVDQRCPGWGWEGLALLHLSLLW